MNTSSSITINGLTLAGPGSAEQGKVFTTEALSFISALHREFGPRIAILRNEGEVSEQALDESEKVARSWKALIDRCLVEPAPSFIAPRGLGRWERRITFQGEPLSAGIVDFALHIQRNAHRLLAEGRAPFISLLGLESEEELMLWQDLFVRAEELLGLPDGTIRAIHMCAGDPDMDDDEDGQASSAAVLTQRRVPATV